MSWFSRSTPARRQQAEAIKQWETVMALPEQMKDVCRAACIPVFDVRPAYDEVLGQPDFVLDTAEGQTHKAATLLANCHLPIQRTAEPQPGVVHVWL